MSLYSWSIVGIVVKFKDLYSWSIVGIVVKFKDFLNLVSSLIQLLCFIACQLSWVI